MNVKLLIVALILTGITACKKSQYTTSPQLTFKSVNATTISRGQLLSFKIDVTDKEGDIQDTIWIQKISYTCPDQGSYLSPQAVPKFTPIRDLKGEFDITYLYGGINQGYPTVSGCSQKNDSCYFRFWLKDKAQNVSDTISSPTILLLK